MSPYLLWLSGPFMVPLVESEGWFADRPGPLVPP